MKQIKLTRGQVSLVDDADFEALSKFKWQAIKTHKQWRAQRHATAIEKSQGLPGAILMHRQLMGYPSSEVDHRNRNSLDNQRHNLRLATHSQQMANSRTRPHGRYRGVRKHTNPNCNRFCARIKDRHLGTFITPEQAALAYDAAAIKEFGEFAVLNFGGAS